MKKWYCEDVNRWLFYPKPYTKFAWWPVEVGALGGKWVWLRRVLVVPGPVTVYQELK